MKLKRILSILAILCVVVTFAANTQRVLKIYSHNEVIGSFPIAVIDSIKIDKSTPSDKLIKIYQNNVISDFSIANIDSVKIEEEIEINPEDIPDNEIWYTTIDNKELSLRSENISDAQILNNTYKNGLGKLVFDNTITTINADAFCAYNEILEIILPSKITNILVGAFRHCKNLNKTTILGELSTIEHLAFWDCSRLESFVSCNASNDGRLLILNNEIKAVAGYNLVNVNIPKSITTIGEGAFQGCSDIENLHIPSNVKIIGNSAFANCINLKNLTLSEGLISIGTQYGNFSIGDSFAYTKIEKVTFPESLEFVDAWSFRGCNNISGFYGNDKFHSPDNKCLYSYLTCGEPLNIPYIAKYVGNDLSYIIPEGIWAIENRAFENLPTLKEVKLPNSLTRIGYEAFYNCQIGRAHV